MFEKQHNKYSKKHNSKLNNNTMKAIINRNETFGTLNGVLTKNEQIRTVVNQHLKQGNAKLLIDTIDTLMYDLIDSRI